MVLTNPPFGKKSSVTIVNEACDEEKQSFVEHRDDFLTSTSNKRLNFFSSPQDESVQRRTLLHHPETAPTES
jgi:hypothetical protein